jgi:hypothetical protein
MSQGGDVIVPESGDAMPNRSRLSVLMGVLGVLQRLPWVLVSRQMILFSLLPGNTMGMRGAVV